MDFFKRIQQPGKYQVVEVEFEHPNKGIPAWNRGIPLTAEQRAKMSAAHKGKPSPMRGKTHSEETRAKISEAKKGRPISAETRAAISAANKGKTRSAETRAKISAANKSRTLSAETRAKMSASNASSKACKTPLGVFRSIKEATRAHNVNVDTVRNRCLNNNFSDWHFVKETA